MSQSSSVLPAWMSDLIAPIIGGVFTVIGGGLVWVAKKVLLDVVQEEIDRKHEENKESSARIEKLLEEGRHDREDMKIELREIRSDVAYLKGRVDAEDT